ncbi:MAG: branched-chain amino acid ABC transporter permease [Micrococcales bacterium]|nr:branched-chain amino acid ABC transporter permease [Micrococcales bacterium]
MRKALDTVRGNVLLKHSLIALLAAALVLLVMESVSPFRQGQLAMMAYYAIAAGGLTVLTGLSGQLSLGHGAFMAIGAYTTALLLQEREGALPMIVIILIAALVATVVGAIVGVAAARLHGPYIAGATLALAVAVPGIALHFSSVFGGEQGLNVKVPEVPRLADDALYFLTGTETSTSEWVAYSAWFLLIIVYFLLANLSASRIGRRWRAVRDDEVAASLAGIDLGRDRVVAFVVSAACAGVAGALLALASRLAAPGSFSLVLSLTLLSAVVLGGLGSLLGALLGSGLLALLPNLATSIGSSMGLSDVKAAELSPLVIGLTTMLVILLAPAGVVGSVRQLLAGRGPRATTAAAGTPGAGADTPTVAEPRG